MQIVKYSGELVEFNPSKLRRTMRRTGVKSGMADDIISAVERRLRTGMTTRDVSRMVREELKRVSQGFAQRYNLKHALLKLGPAGFTFEKYVASILNAYGYKTELPEELQGACVWHEVDVVAKKDNRTVMIEAKFRNDFSHLVRLKDTMATWSRFNDLNDGAKKKTCPHFDQVWIVTNGKISSRSKKFGACKGMSMIGWNYPHGNSLAHMVDHAGLYPITVIESLNASEVNMLAEKNYTLCREIAEEDPARIARDTGISKIRTEKIVSVCHSIVHPEGHNKKSPPVRG